MKDLDSFEVGDSIWPTGSFVRSCLIEPPRDKSLRPTGEFHFGVVKSDKMVENNHARSFATRRPARLKRGKGIRGPGGVAALF